MRKTPRLPILGALLLSGLLPLFLAGQALAADAAAASNPCDFKPWFDRLHAIQADGTQNYLDAIRAQLQVRKTLLRNIIDCSLAEVDGRQKKLEEASFDDARTLTDIAQGLADSKDYYNAQRRSIDDLGIKGTQDLARELATWKASKYNPLAAREDALLLWQQDQSLFTRAESRFDQIKPVVLSMKLISDNGVQSKFQDAQKAFEGAKAKNQAAREAIVHGDTAAATSLIRESLEPLSGIYKTFLELSDEIKKMVP